MAKLIYYFLSKRLKPPINKAPGGSMDLRSICFGVVLLVCSQSLGVLTSSLSIEEKLEIAKTRCAPKTLEEPTLYQKVFNKFNMSLLEIENLYPIIYNSDARLTNRVGYFSETKKFTSVNLKNTSESADFPEHYIKSIILHVENALKLKYAQYIFFPDMGHSHLFIPLEYYNNVMSKAPSRRFIDALELAFKAPNLKTLYHTAEQLRLLDETKNVLSDRHLQWRFYTRNPVIDAHGHIEIHTDFKAEGGYNTLRNLEGHRYYSGYNISANKNGCFPFENASGQIEYFDLSAWDLPYEYAGEGSYLKKTGHSGHIL